MREDPSVARNARFALVVPSRICRTDHRPVGSGGWEDWQWDTTSFAGAASHYVQGRLPYAERVADALQVNLDLDGHGGSSMSDAVQAS